MKTPNKYFSIVILFAFLSISSEIFAQVGIKATGAITPDASSMLDIQSTSKGVLIPRMLTSERTAISTPANGLLVYDTTTNSFWFFNGTIWVELAAATNYVDLTTNQTVGGMKTFTGDLTPAGRLMIPMGK